MGVPTVDADVVVADWCSGGWAKFLIWRDSSLSLSGPVGDGMAHMLPRLLRITSKVYLYDTSAPGLLDTGLLRLLRRVRWSCGQCAFALYTVPRCTDHALLLHYAAESVRLRHGCAAELPQRRRLRRLKVPRMGAGVALRTA